jgi:predicted nuclease of restriction endonuclease-like RecB superfamily
MRNEFEKKIAKQLRKAKVAFQYEGSRIPYLLARHYIPDFILNINGQKVYVECKGYFRPEAKAKMVAVKRLNPQLDIRILFYAHNKKYIKWAEKNGFRWAVGEIPKEWLTGL